jgi:lysophospholipase L1-like esterase
VAEGVIVALGDSLTYGFPYGPAGSWVAEAETLLGRPIVNRGVNGEASFDMLARLEEDVLSFKPACVVILAGSNDALRGGVRWAETETSLVAMAEAVQSRGAQVVFGLPPAVDDPGAEERLKRQRAWLRLEAPRRGWVLIDFAAPLADPETGKIRSELTVDGVHPTKEGYRRMGRAAAEVLARLGFSVSEPKVEG